MKYIKKNLETIVTIIMVIIGLSFWGHIGSIPAAELSSHSIYYSIMGVWMCVATYYTACYGVSFIGGLLLNIFNKEK